MGLEEKIWNNIENNNGGGKNAYLINGITLILILSFYLINSFWNKFLMKIFDANKEDLTEVIVNFIGLYPYILSQIIFSTIFSGLIYYKKIKKLNNIFVTTSINILFV